MPQVFMPPCSYALGRLCWLHHAVTNDALHWENTQAIQAKMSVMKLVTKFLLNAGIKPTDIYKDCKHSTMIRLLTCSKPQPAVTGHGWLKACLKVPMSITYEWNA